MKFISLSLLLVFSSAVFANELCEDDENGNGGGGGGTAQRIIQTVQEQGCPNYNKLKTICMTIGNKMEEEEKDGPHKFVYQTKFHEAACVRAGDSETVRQQKIRETWNKFENEFKCNSPRFDVRDGNLLKFAAHKEFESFLYEAAVIWKVNLNKVDADGLTVLDYLKKKIEENKGNPFEPKFRTYYNMLDKAGAKHRTEL